MSHSGGVGDNEGNVGGVGKDWEQKQQEDLNIQISARWENLTSKKWEEEVISQKTLQRLDVQLNSRPFSFFFFFFKVFFLVNLPDDSMQNA